MFGFEYVILFILIIKRFFLVQQNRENAKSEKSLFGQNDAT